MNKIAIIFFVLIFSLPIIGQNKYEITEVDIFSLDNKTIYAHIISVLGITLDTTIEEILNKFGLTKADLQAKYNNVYYFINPKPGLRIRSHDKETIDSIMITNEFKDNFKGKFRQLFDKNSRPEFEKFVEECMGKPDDYGLDSFMGGEKGGALGYMLAYGQGFIFYLLFGKEENSIAMEITCPDNIFKRLKRIERSTE